MSDKARRPSKPLTVAQVQNFLDTLDDYGCESGRWTITPGAVKELCEAYLQNARLLAARSWRTDKPTHLLGEHHSEDVLILFKSAVDKKPVVRIGHVSLGHWRPEGGNGNFDDNVLGWMPLPHANVENGR